MPRHVTTQSTKSVDAEKGSQDARVPERTAHQRVLDLQVGAGNRATVQTLRRAGDKLAFEPGSGLKGDAETAALKAVTRAIEVHQNRKRDNKDSEERAKEIGIGVNNMDKDVALLRLKLAWPAGHEVLRYLEGQVEEDTIAKHKKTLATYHDRVEGMTGWQWPQLQTQIILALQRVCGPTPYEVSERVDDQATVKVDGKVIYTVHFDDARFVPDRKKFGHRQTFTKKGHEKTGPKGGPDPRKQFVQDVNGVKTRRFVTRAFNVFHLATMFGVSVVPPAWKDTVKIEPTMKLKEKQDALTKNLAMVKYERKKDGLARFGGQEPRDLTKTFSEHANTFNLTKAASVRPGHKDSEFNTQYYADRRKEPGRGQRTKFEFDTGRRFGRMPEDTMKNNEASSMQVRNGSGRGQPFLSAASVQAMPGRRPEKIIRANKGERFDTGAENQGVVKIDLSLLPDEVNVVDQHSGPSHEHKIAWDRYYSKGDIQALADRFDLASRILAEKVTLPSRQNPKDLAKQIVPSDEEIAIFSFSDRRAIKSGKVAKLLEDYDDRSAGDKYTKRSAPKELDEYVYSARKNREVLFDKLPVAAVTEIFLSKDDGKWKGLARKIKRGVWLELAPIKQELTDYLQGRGNYEKRDQKRIESYHNIQYMHEQAEMGKLTEGHTRT